MATRPCDECLDNNWKYEYLDSGRIKAQCQVCLNEVEFEAKKKNKSKGTLIEKVGDPCRKCDGKVILKEPRKHKQKSKTYYTAYYYCEKCKTIFYHPKFKKEKQIHDLFGRLIK